MLPFVNMSSDQEKEHFSEDLSEELSTLLAWVPQLRVIARASSFSVKDEQADTADIARRFNVSHVLEGSVRKARENLAVACLHAGRLDDAVAEYRNAINLEAGTGVLREKLGAVLLLKRMRPER